MKIFPHRNVVSSRKRRRLEREEADKETVYERKPRTVDSTWDEEVSSVFHLCCFVLLHSDERAHRLPPRPPTPTLALQQSKLPLKNKFGILASAANVAAAKTAAAAARAEAAARAAEQEGGDGTGQAPEAAAAAPELSKKAMRKLAKQAKLERKRAGAAAMDTGPDTQQGAAATGGKQNGKGAAAAKKSASEAGDGITGTDESEGEEEGGEEEDALDSMPPTQR